jgi:hypothetical protein
MDVFYTPGGTGSGGSAGSGGGGSGVGGGANPIHDRAVVLLSDGQGGAIAKTVPKAKLQKFDPSIKFEITNEKAAREWLRSSPLIQERMGQIDDEQNRFMGGASWANPLGWAWGATTLSSYTDPNLKPEDDPDDAKSLVKATAVLGRFVPRQQDLEQLILRNAFDENGKYDAVAMDNLVTSVIEGTYNESWSNTGTTPEEHYKISPYEE